MSTLNTFVVNSGEDGLARFAFLMQALTEEIIEELDDKDDEVIGALMFQMGEVIAWIGHGDSERLPEPLRKVVDNIQVPLLIGT